MMNGRDVTDRISSSIVLGERGEMAPDAAQWHQNTPADAARLAELQKYDLLNSAPEAVFDRLTRLGAQVFGAQICLISLVDQDRQWFKAAHGIPVRETKRSSAICDHAIRSPDPTVILDTTQDDRVADNPLVTGWPHIRFYAGAPLITPRGFALGTFCIIDNKPRADLSDADRRTLTDFADMVM